MTARPRPSSGSSSRRTRSTRTATRRVSAADPSASPSEPSRSVEIELKFDADDDTPLPDWTALPGVASVGVAELRELDARYFDTAEFALASAGYALRRRSGGPDAGWHIKGPRIGGGRVELGWPLGDADDEHVPDAVRGAVSSVTQAELRLIARILNTRTAYALRSADGGLVAEFVDDHVTATDVRTGRGAHAGASGRSSWARRHPPTPARSSPRSRTPCWPRGAGPRHPRRSSPARSATDARGGPRVLAERSRPPRRPRSPRVSSLAGMRALSRGGSAGRSRYAACGGYSI